MTQFTLDNSLGYLINRTATRLKRELHRTFKAHGYKVTPEQWGLLTRLWEKEGLSQVELAETTFKDKPNITRMLEVMEKENLIFRQPDEADGRAYKVFLTQEGKDLKEKLVPLVSAMLDRAKEGLTPEDVQHLYRILNIIYFNFE